MHHDPSKRMILIGLYLSVLVYGLFISTVGGMATQSADLYAIWLAAEFTDMGRLDQVYPVTDGLFDMTTPSEWWPHVESADPDARIFPYIYPPIWAKLVSFLTPLMTFATFDTVFLVVHQVLLFGSIYCATRMTNLRGLTQLCVLTLTYAALVLTTPVGLALAENQPQILVSFLIVCAFERAHFGRYRSAGALLALAAAIKCYPVLFIVIFLARRQWPAVISFAFVGAGLALTSVVIAGWPLHAEFLEMLRTLTRSVIVTNFSFSIDAYLSGTVFSKDLVQVSQPYLNPYDIGWTALAKPPLWVLISSIANLAAIGGAAYFAARYPREPFVMPIVAIALALLSPLSWAYTYLTALVFVGTLPIRLGGLWIGFLVVMAIFFHRSLPMATWGTFGIGLTGGWILGGLMFAIIGIAMFWAMLRAPIAQAKVGLDAPQG